MLGAESAVLILDDTEGVWPRHAANLLQVSVCSQLQRCRQQNMQHIWGVTVADEGISGMGAAEASSR